MLHAEELLENGSGTVIASADNASTLGQTITTNVAAGTYYLVVESDQHDTGISIGQGYDVGQYTVSGTIVSGSSAPTFTLSGSSSMNEQSSYTLSLSATDPGQTISTWFVTWGDGTTQTVTGDPSSVAHTYSAGPNNYTISATATDGTGTYSASNTIAVSVAHVPPTLTLSGASSVNEGSLYTLGLSGIELSGHAISSWSITWGDGNTQVLSGNPASVTHTYALGPQTDTITATATDDVGTYSAGNSVAVSVAHVPPTLTLSGASSVNEGSLYTLGLSGIELSGHAISSWSITWGDGNTQVLSGNPASVTHTYALGPHTETITATATDDVNTYSAGNSVVVSVAHVPPTVSISGASSVNEQSIYTLNLSATEVAAHSISGWVITWGDGSAPQNLTGNPSSVNHTYLAAGAYTISASVTDDVSTYAAASHSVTANKVPPTLLITGPSTGAPGSAYILNLSATESDSDFTIIHWVINWG